jgi:hypothetical protein
VDRRLLGNDADLPGYDERREVGDGGVQPVSRPARASNRAVVAWDSNPSGYERALINQVLLYAGSALPVIWGIAHLFPTRSVVDGFGDISLDNRRIITMEWIIEGVALIFIGTIVGAVTYVDRSSDVSRLVYTLVFATLNVLSVVSLLTGFKIGFLPFKMCPVIFTTSSILILAGVHI